MGAALKLAFLMLGACSLNAQITAVLNRSSVYMSEVAIRNNSTLNLTAFAISMPAVKQDAGDDAPFTFWADTAVDTDRLALPGELPLRPNHEHTVPLPSRRRQGLPEQDLFGTPIVVAGVFADGTMAGDANLLARLISRRGNMLQAVELAREILTDAGKRNVRPTQLIEQFRQLAESLNHWYLPPEQQVGRSLYQSLIGELMNLPDLPVGSPFPPTDLVERETAALNRQRTTLLESQPRLSLAMETVPDRR